VRTMFTRRRLLATAALASAAGILPIRRAGATEAAPEIKTIRFAKFPAICFAPQYVCEELLRAEGFTDIRYLDTDGTAIPHDLGRGKFDFATSLAMQYIVGIDAGASITLVSGVHAGCYELFAHEGIRGVADLKGKRIGLTATPELIQMMAAYVGLDPKKDITLVSGGPEAKPLELFAEGKLDAYLALPPEVQELHARKLGHVIVRTAVDRPWSQYFCCALAGNREFVVRHPVATRRVVRAILKAADLCASEPEQAARRLVDGGFTEHYDYAVQTLNENPYGHWREYNPEDSIRFYALRLHELGMIKSTPQRILADGTDWRFFDELKRELKV
jgi:NitT/TauT family transport system substrate-binding protein